MRQQAAHLLLLIGCAVLAILPFVGIFSLISSWKLRRLRREREGKGLTRENFIISFRQIGVPDEIPAAVFDYYTSNGMWKDFPLSPDDAYSEVLWDDPDDLDDDVNELAERLKLRPLPERVLQEYGEKPLTTLRDMVMWLDWIRQRQQPGSVPT